MIGSKHALLIGVVASLLLPWSARAGDLAGASGRITLAQFDSGPGEGYGSPPPGGPYGGYGPQGGGYGPQGGYGPAEGMGPQDGVTPYRGARRSGRSAQHVTYHGFRIDLTQTGPGSNVASDVAAAEHQIDIVDQAGLSVTDLTLFHHFPIEISPGQHRGGGGHYRGGSTVTISDLVASDTRPVLLHEYMHVLHHSALPGGFRNPDIMRFYEEAVSRNLYPQGSYMLSNPQEFFAMTASCYLNGTVARPPYNRDTIRTQQPDYYAYLERLFRGGRGQQSSVLPARSVPAPAQAVHQA